MLASKLGKRKKKKKKGVSCRHTTVAFTLKLQPSELVEYAGWQHSVFATANCVKRNSPEAADTRFCLLPVFRPLQEYLPQSHRQSFTDEVWELRHLLLDRNCLSLSDESDTSWNMEEYYCVIKASY